MQEILVILIVLLATAAAIYHLVRLFRAMSGKENPCKHCASSQNCRLIQENKEKKLTKNTTYCKKREEKSC